MVILLRRGASIGFLRPNSLMSLARTSASYILRRRAGLVRRTRSIDTSCADPPPLPLPPPLPPFALASARAAFLAAASACCSGVNVGLAPFCAFSFLSSCSAIETIPLPAV